MRRISIFASIVVMISVGLACGDDRDPGSGGDFGNEQAHANHQEDEDIATTPEREFADAYGQLMYVEVRFAEYRCPCHWSDDDFWPNPSTDFSSEQDCLDSHGVTRDENALQACMRQALEDVPPFDGDETELEGVTTCIGDVVDNNPGCVESVPETCSESNTEQLEECDDELNSGLYECIGFDESGDVTDWLGEFQDKVQPQCIEV